MYKIYVHDLCFYMFRESYVCKFYDGAVLLTELVRYIYIYIYIYIYFFFRKIQTWLCIEPMLLG